MIATLAARKDLAFVNLRMCKWQKRQSVILTVMNSMDGLFGSIQQLGMIGALMRFYKAIYNKFFL
jgi:hypothetical protein